MPPISQKTQHFHKSFDIPDAPTVTLYKFLIKKGNAYAGVQKRFYTVANALYPDPYGTEFQAQWTLDTSVFSFVALFDRETRAVYLYLYAYFFAGSDLNIVTTELAEALHLRQGGKCDPQFGDHTSSL